SDKEGYRLKIDGEGIQIQASAQAGLAYAFSSLRQLLFNYGCNLPYCLIDDEPYLKHRGLLFDVGRYYYSKQDVFKIIDICYLHKLNVLHWHLTEDQGWRIEIDKYPLLTQKGSKRSHTNFGIKPHKGFYTKDDIREIIKYANDRNIQVFPEIDMPGHIQSALACYPQLGCFDRKLPVATHWGVKHDPLCAGKESVYEFVFDVLDEVIELFGGNTKYIHIGGDEVFKHRWKLCERCQAVMKQEGMDSEEELLGYFMRRVSQYVVDKGFIPILWNGLNASIDVHPQVVWQFWGGEGENGNDAARSVNSAGGHIVSDSEHTYLDFPYGRLSLKKSYSFNPLHKGIKEEKLVGAEVSLWTEYVPNFKTACARLLPRLCALSEAMWLEGEKDYEDFERRLPYTVKYLAKEGYASKSLKVANPSKFRGSLQKAWFNRRVLHWQGLHNLIDDAYVNRKFSKKSKTK
ncbi:MAG: beta-N-acetylhexosaminidase, partial [Clostridia bacterium]|nr:beta-N-acetylhexosaminidase [Clostridia bacterium]